MYACMYACMWVYVCICRRVLDVRSDKYWSNQCGAVSSNQYSSCFLLVIIAYIRTRNVCLFVDKMYDGVWCRCE